MSYYNNFPGLLFQPLHPYTQAYVAAMSVKPTATRTRLIDNLVRSLVSSGAWNYLSSMPLLKSHDSQAARVDLINPSNVYSLIGTPTFAVDAGYTMSGSNGLNSGMNLSTDAKYKQNDAHLGVWCNTNVNENAADISNTSTVQQSGIRSREPSVVGVFGQCNHGGTGATYATFAGNGWTATSVGHSVVQRNNAANAVSSTPIYKNGVKATSLAILGSAASAAVVNANFRIGQNATKQIACAHFGSNMPDATVTALYNALNTYFSSF